MKPFCFIPARVGSKRIPGKNMKELNGHPLISYTIAAAKQAKIFENRIYCSTDDQKTADFACRMGVNVPFLRPAEQARDESTDFDWISYLAERVIEPFDVIFNLRPTSPFRTSDTIKRAWHEWQENQPCSSMRAIEKVRQHPLKMWRQQKSGTIVPFINNALDGSFNNSTQSLPTAYIQNGSLEIFHLSTLRRYGNVSGHLIAPFFTADYEGFDINVPDDWILAEALIEKGLAKLPEVKA